MKTEWICGCIAQSLNLPIPPFCPLICSPELSDAWVNSGRGCERLSSPFMRVVFGSMEVPSAVDVRDVANLDGVSDAEQMAAIYLFDKVIQNIDRTEENSNILLKFGEHQGFYIIDHSNAFTRKFDTADFSRTHLFRDAFASCSEETRRRLIQQFKERVNQGVINRSWDGMPSEWQDDLSDDLDLSSVNDIVLRGVGKL